MLVLHVDLIYLICVYIGICLMVFLLYRHIKFCIKCIPLDILNAYKVIEYLKEFLFFFVTCK